MTASRPVVYTAIAVLVLIWGTTWGAIRIGLEGIPPLTGLALRFAIASAGLLALAPALGVRLGQSRTERRLWVASALLNFCLSYGLIYWAEQWVPSGLAAVLFATFPLWTALLAHFTLPGERLRPAPLAGALVGFAGVAVIFSEDLRALAGPRVAFAAAVVLASPVASALGNVAIKRWGGGIHPLSLSAVPMGLAVLVLGPLGRLAEAGREITFDTRSVLAVLYLALFGSAVTFMLYYWLLQRLSATSLSLITYATPVVAVTVGTLFLDEPFTPRILSGAALVVAGVAVAVRARSRQPRQG